MSDAFEDVSKMKKIKEAIAAHQGKKVEMTLDHGRKREKKKVGVLVEVFPSLFVVEYKEEATKAGEVSREYTESYTYPDILTEANLIHFLED